MGERCARKIADNQIVRFSAVPGGSAMRARHLVRNRLALLGGAAALGTTAGFLVAPAATAQDAATSDFSLRAPGAMTVRQGGTASVPLGIHGIGSFNQVVHLSVAGAPGRSTAAVQPGSVTVRAPSTATA